MPRVLFILTSHRNVEGREDLPTGYAFTELAHPYKVFRDAGYGIEFATVQEGGQPCAEPGSVNLNDPVNSEFHNNEELMNQVKHPKSINQVDSSAYQAVYLVGGFGAAFDFPFCEDIARIIREVYHRGGYIGAVCHGPMGLVNSEIVQGKNVTAFTNDEEQQMGMLPYLPEHQGGAKSCEDVLKNLGANFHKAPPMKKCVQCDERLVTGQNPASAAGVAEKIVEGIQA
jgi:putative intracellular protease/amidase